MTESKRNNEIHREIAELKRRVSKLEYGLQEIAQVVDPKGWIGEAFTLFEEDVDENFAKVHQELSQMNRKIDIILQHITGISQSSDFESR